MQEAARLSDHTIADPPVRPAVKINGAKARSALDLRQVVHEVKSPRSHGDETGRCSNDLLVSCMIASRQHAGPHEKDPGGAARRGATPWATRRCTYARRAYRRRHSCRTDTATASRPHHHIPHHPAAQEMRSRRQPHAESRPRRRRGVHGAWPPDSRGAGIWFVPSVSRGPMRARTKPYKPMDPIQLSGCKN